MKSKTIFFSIFLISILLIIAGCTKPECKKTQDCKLKPYYSVECAEKKCVYNVLSEYQCATIEPCAGKISGSTNLEKYCSEDKKECLSTIPPEKVKPISLSTEQSAAGDRFKITTDFNQPFNTRKDKLNTKITLQQQANTNSEEKITRVELIGTTKDRRTITLAEKQVDKTLWTEGSEINIPLIIKIAGKETDGELTNLILKIYYNYVQISGSTKQVRENLIQNTYTNFKFVWAQPQKPYNCPPICNEEGDAMQGSCDTTTGFCNYAPILNKCGNNICEQNENKCSCAQDCGPCAVSTGVYSTRQCTQDNKCTSVPKQGITITPKNILDEQNKGGFTLQNNYKFNNPFNAKTDKITAEISLYQLQPQVSSVKIETIRLLEGTQQIAELDVNKELSSTTSTIKEELTIPQQSVPETDKSITIAIWYQYTQNNLVQKGKLEKSLEKITILSPD